MQTNKLYVGNLNYETTQQDLEELFQGHGTVIEVKLIEGKGFGFVEMSTPEEAESAKEKLDGTDFKGRTMRVDEARPQTDRRSGGGGGGRGGSRGGGGGGRGGGGYGGGGGGGGGRRY
ncbi:MAG: RNA-binding protein [Candidatus Aminicenantes bacterium]|nr:RNA-binding protein [Candidatus Aminicenantes bacterium]